MRHWSNIHWRFISAWKPTGDESADTLHDSKNVSFCSPRTVASHTKRFNVSYSTPVVVSLEYSLRLVVYSREPCSNSGSRSTEWKLILLLDRSRLSQSPTPATHFFRFHTVILRHHCAFHGTMFFRFYLLNFPIFLLSSVYFIFSAFDTFFSIFYYLGIKSNFFLTLIS